MDFIECILIEYTYTLTTMLAILTIAVCAFWMGRWWERHQIEKSKWHPWIKKEK